MEEKRPIIYGVDFDGTLSLGSWPAIGPANQGLIRFLLARQEEGDKIILWTCRAGKELEDAVDWCRDHGLIFDAVNDNLPETVALYGGNNSRKISCDYYIDDRAVDVLSFCGSLYANPHLTCGYGGLIPLYGADEEKIVL